MVNSCVGCGERNNVLKAYYMRDGKRIYLCDSCHNQYRREDR